MPSELDEDEFEELTSQMEESVSDRFSMELDLMKVNPYVAIKSPRRLPGTREEVLSALRSNFTEDQYYTYTLSFIDADKEDSQYVYKILIKEQTDDVFDEPE